MAITITGPSQDRTLPIEVSDCLQWCFEADAADVLDVLGSFATLTVNFPAVPTIPANGTAFTLWGVAFTVNNSVPSSNNTFQVTAIGSVTAGNFRRMLNANFFFANTTIGTDGFVLRNTVVTWNECGEQDNFAGVNMDFAGLISAGATAAATNGVTAVFTNGYSIQSRLLKVDPVTNVAAPITKYEGAQPGANCNTVSELCINYMEDAKRTIFTPMPDLSVTSEIDPDIPTMIGRFQLQYGWVYKDDNCLPKSGDFAITDEYLVIDTVFELQENYGMRRYWYDHKAGIAPLSPQFLTNKPKYLTLGQESFAWLWLAAGYQSLSPITNIVVRFNVFYKNGTTAFVDVNYSPLEDFKVHCFNVSPKRLIALFSLPSSLATVSHYFVKATADTGDTVGWETYFYIEHACENMVDVYFKTPPGGIGTILMDVVDRDIVQEGTEICLNTSCSTTRQEAAKYGGKTQNRIRSYDTVTLKARRSFNDEEVAYFRSLKASPERWIQVAETGLTGAGYLNNYIAKRLLVDTGGIRIYQNGEYVDLIITGKTGDIPLQTPRNV